MTSDSEFRAYHHIENMLKRLGWDTRNPAKGGDVYTQGEFKKHDTLLESALGSERPENVVRIGWDGGYHYWIIEAKRIHKELTKALKEAKEYAEKINKKDSEHFARFATGVAGTPDNSFLVETHYWNGKEWGEVSINNHATTGFLSREQCQDILSKNTGNVAQFDDSPDRFLEKANAINKTLHNNGIAVGDRAKMMGALLLAMADDGNMRIHSDPEKMIREVNGNILHILREHGKEEFSDTIRLILPATAKNHRDYRKAIVETLQHLREMNVRSAINGKDDALGKFYETFLKYANGAKEMGIVLTPRHITKFAVDVLGITRKDKIFDPACGTGGFLVSAMDALRDKFRTVAEYNKFKESNLFGVEKEDSVYGLALVNMIFRGDGKSGLQDGNCFDHEFWQVNDRVCVYMHKNGMEPENPKHGKRPFSKVLMNPPFKLNIGETEFVDYALRQMKKGGMLFAILPEVSIGGKKFENWRQELIKRHTVKAVVKLDKNVFYPIQEGTYGLIVKAHNPHKANDKTFVGMLHDDEHRHRRSKMLSRHEAVDNVERLTDDLRRFLLNKPVEDREREQTITTINPESFSSLAYIKDTEPKNMPYLIDRGLGLVLAKIRAQTAGSLYAKEADNLKAFPLSNFIKKIEMVRVESLKELPAGKIPVVSATIKNNGIDNWKDVQTDKLLENCISISKTHNTKPCQAFWHPYKFAAIGTVHVIKPISEFTNKHAVLYLCQAITDANAWRYDYASTVDLNELKVYLPTLRERGGVDYKTIIAEGKRQVKIFENLL